MRIVEFVTPEEIKLNPIKCLKDRKLINEFINNCGKVPIVQYTPGPNKKTGGKFTSYRMLAQLNTTSKYSAHNLIWHTGSLLNSTGAVPPNWSGFIQHMTSHLKNTYSKSKVAMLLLIDLQPSNETCIYSTLLFVKNQSKNLYVDVPCITFDLLLWYKANKIINDKNLNMVCRLGGFHTLMRFLGSIGTYMTGSGIEQALALVYAPITVNSFLTGKAYATQ